MSSDFATASKSFIAGGLAGACGVTVYLPFDIIKVRLQNTGGTNLSVISSLIKNEGVLAFWKGYGPCLLEVCTTCSVSFGVVESCKNYMIEKNDGPLALYQYAMCGICSGSCTSFFSTVTEGIKIRMQTQGYLEYRGDNYYSNSFKYTIDLVRLKGIKGLYRGFIPTYFRDAIGDASYYTTYHAVPFYLLGISDDSHKRNFFNIVLSGGLSGMAFSLFTYPMDVVKTRMQSDSIINPKYSGNIECLNHIIREGGTRALFNGLIPCLLKSFPLNSALFLGFEFFKKLLNKIE